MDGKALWGGYVNKGWWHGSEVPAAALAADGVSVTRYMPGRTVPRADRRGRAEAHDGAPGMPAGARIRSSGQGQGLVVDRNPLDLFVREHLATALMKMAPRDGSVANSDENWRRADDRGGWVLLYSLSGPSITLARALGQGVHTGLWFDPRTGESGAPRSRRRSRG